MAEDEPQVYALEGQPSSIRFGDLFRPQLTYGGWSGLLVDWYGWMQRTEPMVRFQVQSEAQQPVEGWLLVAADSFFKSEDMDDTWGMALIRDETPLLKALYVAGPGREMLVELFGGLLRGEFGMSVPPHELTAAMTKPMALIARRSVVERFGSAGCVQRAWTSLN